MSNQFENGPNCCPECESENLMFSKKRQVYLCDVCGHEFVVHKSSKPLRIFFSYGHDHNEKLVQRIKVDLEERGHDIWFDNSEIKSGDEWRRNITEGIAGSHRVVLFLSKCSTNDPGVCLDEIGIAIGIKGDNIQTILVEGEKDVRPPPSISHVQRLDMQYWRLYQDVGQDIWNAWYGEKIAEIIRVVESDESVCFTDETQEFMAKLKPVKSNIKTRELLLKPFVGRKWIHDSVEAWRNDRQSDSRLFWVVGAPGVGKSAFVTNFAHFGKGSVIALHFCERNKQSHKDPRQVVLNIAFQLACRFPSYRKNLLDFPETNKLNIKDAGELFDYLLVKLLLYVIDAKREKYIVIIDAIDEANVDGRNAIAEFLMQHVDLLPDGIILLITSRPEEEAMRPLRGLSGLKPVMLEMDSEENHNDIREYLHHRLPNAGEVVVNAILDKSGGVFLYAEYICEQLRQSQLSLGRFDEFPNGLDGIYAQYFARQFSDLGEYKSTTRHALGILISACEPLEPDFLASSSDWDTYQLEDFLDSLGSLLRKSEGRLYPFHKSLFDWLSDKAKSGNYFVSAEEGQNRLAGQGMREYRHSLRDLLPYNLRHLPFHLVECERRDELIGNDRIPGLLTDLRFIQAKCEAGLVHELVADYNKAQAALLEFAEESERWITEKSSGRADRLRHFGTFTSNHLKALVEQPAYTLPIVWNSADSGPVFEQAEKLISGFKLPWLRRSPRPHSGPLCSQCLRPLEGHSSDVSSLMFTPDGRRVVSTSWDKTLRIWDFENGFCLRSLEGHSDFVLSAIITPDGSRVVSISRDSTLRIWDLETGDCLRIIKGYVDWDATVVMSPDGHRVVLTGRGDTLRVWDIEKGECLHVFKGHYDDVYSMSISPDGRRVISAGEDGELRLWDIETGVCLQILKDHESPVLSVDISPNGKHAISAGCSRAFVWSLVTGTCICSLDNCGQYCWNLVISPDGRRIVSIVDYVKIVTWDLFSGKCLYTFDGYTSSVESVIVSPDGRYIVCGSEDKTVRVLDIENGKCLAVYYADSKVLSVAISTTGDRIVCGMADGQVHFLRPVNFPVPGPVILTAKNDSIASCPLCNSDFTPLPNVIVAIPQDANFPSSPEFFDDPRLLSDCPHCGKPLKFNPFFSDGGAPMYSESIISPFEKLIDATTGTWRLEKNRFVAELADGQVTAWLTPVNNGNDPNLVSPEFDIRNLRAPRSCPRFSSDSKFCIIEDEDSGTILYKMGKQGLEPTDICVGNSTQFSGDSQLLSTVRNNEMAVWSFVEKKYVSRGVPRNKNCSVLRALSSDGRVLLVTSCDLDKVQCSEVWDTRDSKLLFESQCLCDWPVPVLTPNGSHLVAVRSDNMLCVWDLFKSQLIHEEPAPEEPRLLAVASDASVYACVTKNNEIILRSGDTTSKTSPFGKRSRPKAMGTIFLTSSCLQIVYCKTDGDELYFGYIFDIEAGRLKHGRYVAGREWKPDDDQFEVAYEAIRYRLHSLQRIDIELGDFTSPSERMVLPPWPDYWTAYDVSPDGKIWVLTNHLGAVMLATLDYASNIAVRLWQKPDPPRRPTRRYPDPQCLRSLLSSEDVLPF